MAKFIYTYLLSLPIIFAVDMLWLGLFAKNMYARLMAPAVTIEFYWPAVIAFYLLYIVGVFYFAVTPGVAAASLQKTILYGALFGFFCYMTYDLTNLATVKNWPISLVFIDIAWGVFLSSAIAAIAYKIYFWLA